MNTEQLRLTKIIADFLQDNKNGLYSDEGTFLPIEGESIFTSFTDMKFHKSYDWLMLAWNAYANTGGVPEHVRSDFGYHLLSGSSINDCFVFLANSINEYLIHLEQL